MRKPLIVVTGVDPTAMQATMASLVWALPDVVAIRHVIEPITQQLSRFVSSMHGSEDTADIDLQHACVGCAVREDILPTILRLSQEPEWKTIVACLPVSAEADHLCATIARDAQVSRYVRLASVISTVPGEGAVDHLLDSDWLGESGLQTGPGDPRSVGEAACAQVEYADLIVSMGAISEMDGDFISALMRPTAEFVPGIENIDVEALTSGRHSSREAHAWRNPRSEYKLPNLGESRAWRIDLSSTRPFHPERLMDEIQGLSGRFRSRGCFWVPTRPSMANTWEGVDGQVSIGQHSEWDPDTPLTRLILTGVGCAPNGVHTIFGNLLLSNAEVQREPGTWLTSEDGLEPWLGDIPHAA